jgi:hypothetical protein
MAQNINLELTVEAWADIVIKNWRQKITQLDIGFTGQLFDSFIHTVISNSGGKIERIEFAFNYYGKFVDMGVGKEISLGNIGAVETRRRAKKWYSSVMYSQALKLRDILGEKYGILGAGVIAENIREGEKEYKQSKRSGAMGDAGNRAGFAVPRNEKTELTELDRVWMHRNGLL